MIPFILISGIIAIFCASSAFNFLAKYFYSHSKLVFGTLYPAYKSYKAIKRKDAREHSRWMMYWVCYGIFNAVEFFADFFIAFWFPFYYETKIIFILWLTSPYGNGAKVFYKSIIHPELNKHEEIIDSYINKATIFSFNGINRLWRNISAPINNVLSYGLIHVLFPNGINVIGSEMISKEPVLSMETEKEPAFTVKEIMDKPIEMETDIVIETVIDSSTGGKENINENGRTGNLSRENGRLRPKRDRKPVVK